MKRLLIVAGALAVLAGAPLAAQDSGGHRRSSDGKQVFQRANCVGCHKWHGGGGGSYGGAALSLRTSELTREQIIEVLNCGRPGTGMPYHLREAYTAGGCNGMTLEELGKDAPVKAAALLRPSEIEAVTDYMIANVQRRGEPTYAECAAFFGEGARVCNTYKAADATAAKQE